MKTACSIKEYCVLNEYFHAFYEDTAIFFVPTNQVSAFDAWCEDVLAMKIFDYVVMPNFYVYTVLKGFFLKEVEKRNFGIPFVINQTRYMLVVENTESKFDLIKAIRSVKYLNSAMNLDCVGLIDAKNLVEVGIEKMTRVPVPCGIYPIL